MSNKVLVTVDLPDATSFQVDEFEAEMLKAGAVFMTEGMRSGYEPALRKFYRLNSFADLDAAWQRHAFGDGAAARGN